jgi:hypothetical protein
MTFYPIAALYPLLHKNVTKPIKYKSVPIIANSYHDLRDCEIYEISEEEKSRILSTCHDIFTKYAVEASLDSIHIKHKDMLDPKNYSLEECSQFGLMDV